MYSALSMLLVLAWLLVFASSQKNPNMLEGRNTIVHLFEWKFEDIAAECERFLQYKGYGGVQVSPISENLIVENRPWWERYQPISYNIITRSGNESDFLNMTTRCNAVGIRIYVDVIFNHMTASSGTGYGTGGSIVQGADKYYPAIPYTWQDFNGDCEVNDYSNPDNVRNCQLGGLHDLRQVSETVRGPIVRFLNRLIHLGVAGFRVDAAKHMWPIDLNVIFNRVNDLNTNFGFAPRTRPYIYQEVIDLGGEAISANEYTSIGDVTEFKHSAEIGRVFSGLDKLVYLDSWGTGWGFLNSSDALVFVDNHDNQRGHGAGGANILTYKNPKQYKMAIAFMLANPYGTTRVMSSFGFTDSEAGPPSNSNQEILSPGINDDDTCSNGWICEHRWRQVYNMIGFKNAVYGTNVTNWWSNGDQQIAFCRGDKGFISFTNGGDIMQRLETCLPSGSYCDVISGGKINGTCTGTTVVVDGDTYATINLKQDDFDGVLAIHVGERL